jgi:hypothetical protein
MSEPGDFQHNTPESDLDVNWMATGRSGGTVSAYPHQAWGRTRYHRATTTPPLRRRKQHLLSLQGFKERNIMPDKTPAATAPERSLTLSDIKVKDGISHNSSQR